MEAISIALRKFSLTKEEEEKLRNFEQLENRSNQLEYLPKFMDEDFD